MEALSDAAVVARVLGGDVDAYGVLVRRYRDPLLRYAARMLGSREDGEEALQDALVRAYRALPQCADPARFGAWLFRIVVNQCRTTRTRRWRRERTFVADDEAVLEAPDPATLGDDAADGAGLEAVERALARLDPAQREAFLLKHVEELSYEEIAELTGVGISALKMRVKRACDRLRELLEEVGNVGS